MTISLKRRTNLTKEVQNVYSESYLTLLTAVYTLGKWESISCSWIGRLNVVMAVLPKLTFGFSATPVSVLADLFVEIGKLIPQFMWTCKGYRKLTQF